MRAPPATVSLAAPIQPMQPMPWRANTSRAAGHCRKTSLIGVSFVINLAAPFPLLLRFYFHTL